MEVKNYSIEELEQISIMTNVSYFFPDLWAIKDQFFSLTKSQIKQSLPIQSTLVILHIISGDLQKAQNLLDEIPENPYKDLIRIVFPAITDAEFYHTIRRMHENNMKMRQMTFSTGRPTFLNGFRDFTRFGQFLKKKKDTAISAFNLLYGNLGEEVYNIALAEYLYQINDSLNAMMIVTAVIPKLEKAGDMRALFVSLYLQMYILLINGQGDSVAVMMKELHQRISKTGSAELKYNIEALEAWLYMYEGNVEKITEWMEQKAPDEFGDFNMLDLFRYMIKLRCYLLTGKYMALMKLAEKLRPYLQAGHRRMDLCEMDMIVAMAAFQVCKFDEAFDMLELLMKNAKRYKFYRLLGNEGSLMVKLLLKYRKERPNSKYIGFVNKVLDIARDMAIKYPDYLVLPYVKEINLTNTEKDVLKLLNNGKSYDEIGDFYDISLNTVRYHIKNIYTKLDVNSANKAITKAKLMGIL